MRCQADKNVVKEVLIKIVLAGNALPYISVVSKFFSHSEALHDWKALL